MKRWYLSLLTVLFIPGWAFAATNPINFTPPSTDYSMVFLSNIFGVVDGVLHGTGSQILGTIFGVFNSAVLALGGIIILYTMMISTVNTAHEGQFLGKAFSSAWIPIRTVAGIGLLLPKASGYCTMQIFVMWVVVQGVGAADRVWDGALGYLQRGGVLIQPIAANNTIAGTGIPPSAGAAARESAQRGAAIIAAQQPNAYKMLQLATCAYVLERVLKDNRDVMRKQNRCDDTTWSCKSVPNFTASVNFLSAADAGTPTVQIPFTSDPYYGPRVNGVCGTISWTMDNAGAIASNIGLNVDDQLVKQAARARTVAVQQMWLEMSSTARNIVTNLYDREVDNRMPLGVSSDNGLIWKSPIIGAAPLLTGTEINAAASSYLGIMSPTLNALSGSISASTEFIQGAKAQGWIMAGSYFFKLAKLNQDAAGYKNDTGSVSVNTGPAFNLSLIRPSLGSIFSTDVESLYNNLLGSASPGTSYCRPIDPSTRIQTVASYICNAMRLKTVGQLGTTPPTFTANYDVTWITVPELPAKHFSGGKWGIPGRVGQFVYDIFRIIFNVFIKILNMILKVMLTAIFTPIVHLTIPVFMKGIASAMYNYTNPIVTLAELGNNLINLSVAVWLISMVSLAAISGIPMIGSAGVTLTIMFMPFFMTWLAAMFTAGVSLAFYIPLLPYMLFVFGALGWMVQVVEAMVAAPIMALGIAHPEGQHELFGKSEQGAVMLVNVFLRPSLMVIGFIVGILMAYVGIWLLNTGFQSVISGLIGPAAQGIPQDALWASAFSGSPNVSPGNVTGFAGIIGIIILILVYITMYITIVKTSIEKMMFKFADEIMVWIGARPSSFGQMFAGGAKEVQGAVDSGAGAMKSAGGQSHGNVKTASDKKRQQKGKEKQEAAKGSGSGKADGIQSAQMSGGAGVKTS